MNEEMQEEAAKEYFGEDFVKEFENLRIKLKEEQTILRLHGTNKESAENILKTGLKICYSSLCYTSLGESSYYTMKNWEHKDYKYLVLIGIPLEATKWGNNKYNEKGELEGFEIKDSKPLFEVLENGNQRCHTVYELPAEFIIGYVDVNEKKIIENPLYLSEHTYEGLYVIDSELGYDSERIVDVDEFFGRTGEELSEEWTLEGEASWERSFKMIDDNISLSDKKDAIATIKEIQDENEKGEEEKLPEEDYWGDYDW